MLFLNSILYKISYETGGGYGSNKRNTKWRYSEGKGER